MLAARGVLAKPDLVAIERGFGAHPPGDRGRRFAWSEDAEDVHLNIARRWSNSSATPESASTPPARATTVATDVRLWLRDEIDAITVRIATLQRALLDQAERHADTVMRLHPICRWRAGDFRPHLLAYFEMFERDRDGSPIAAGAVNRLPLGAAALAGTTFSRRRRQVARELGFEEVAGNSLDAVSAGFRDRVRRLRIARHEPFRALSEELVL